MLKYKLILFKKEKVQKSTNTIHEIYVKIKPKFESYTVLLAYALLNKNTILL